MHEVLSQLSNREVALLVWLGIFSICAVAYRPVRETLGPILKLVFFSRITLALLAMLVYEAAVVLGFHFLRLWHLWMLKDALFWLFGSAILLFLNASEATEDEHYFRKIAIDNIKFAMVLDFILNLYVFNIFVELVLVPVLITLVSMSVVAGAKTEYAQAKKVTNWLLVTIGLGFLTYALIEMLTDLRGFATAKNLEDFLVPIVLTFTFLPFVYALALYSAYEVLFVRVNMWLRNDRQLVRYAKRQIIKACRFRLSLVGRFTKEQVNRLSVANSSADIDQLLVKPQEKPRSR